MVRMPWLTHLWPGLPQLWYWGRWSGLALAVAFAALASSLLVASFVWTELLTPGQLRLGWLSAGAGWFVWSARSAWRGIEPRRGVAAADTMFRAALGEYLQENWFEAEQTLERLLVAYPHDVEARLLRGTLLRHTGRWDEALKELDRLEQFAEANRWSLEVAAERRLLQEAMNPPAGEDAGDAETHAQAA